MSLDDVEKTVVAIISEVCCCTREFVIERMDNHPLDDFIDSLCGFEILCEIENQLYTTINEHELEKLKTIDALVHFIRQNKNP